MNRSRTDKKRTQWINNRYIRMMQQKSRNGKVIRPRMWGRRNPEEYFNIADSPGSFVLESPKIRSTRPDEILSGQYDVYDIDNIEEPNGREHAEEPYDRHVEMYSQPAEIVDGLISQSPEAEAPTTDYLGDRSSLLTRSNLPLSRSNSAMMPERRDNFYADNVECRLMETPQRPTNSFSQSLKLQKSTPQSSKGASRLRNISNASYNRHQHLMQSRIKLNYEDDDDGCDGLERRKSSRPETYEDQIIFNSPQLRDLSNHPSLLSRSKSQVYSRPQQEAMEENEDDYIDVEDLYEEEDNGKSGRGSEVVVVNEESSPEPVPKRILVPVSSTGRRSKQISSQSSQRRSFRRSEASNEVDVEDAAEYGENENYQNKSRKISIATGKSVSVEPSGRLTVGMEDDVRQLEHIQNDHYQNISRRMSVTANRGVSPRVARQLTGRSSRKLERESQEHINDGEYLLKQGGNTQYQKAPFRTSTTVNNEISVLAPKELIDDDEDDDMRYDGIDSSTVSEAGTRRRFWVSKRRRTDTYEPPADMCRRDGESSDDVELSAKRANRSAGPSQNNEFNVYDDISGQVVDVHSTLEPYPEAVPERNLKTKTSSKRKPKKICYRPSKRRATKEADTINEGERKSDDLIESITNVKAKLSYGSLSKDETPKVVNAKGDRVKKRRRPKSICFRPPPGRNSKKNTEREKERNNSTSQSSEGKKARGHDVSVNTASQASMKQLQKPSLMLDDTTTSKSARRQREQTCSHLTPVSGNRRRVSFAPDCQLSPGNPSYHSTPFTTKKRPQRGKQKSKDERTFTTTPEVSSSAPSKKTVLKSGTLEEEEIEESLIDSDVKSPEILSKKYDYCYIKPQDLRREEADRTPGVRRSKRTRVPRLRLDRGDKVYYKRTAEGLVVDFVRICRPKENTEGQRKIGKKLKEAEAESVQAQLMNAEVASNNRVKVLNEAGEDHEEALFFSKEMVDLKRRGKGLYLHKLLSDCDFSNGKLVIDAGAEKSMQKVEGDRLIFNIISGRVLVSVHTTTFELQSGGGFTVPPGNVYGIKNIGGTRASLCFVQIKQKPHSMED